MPLNRRHFIIGSALSAAVAARGALAAPATLRLLADTPALYKDIFATGTAKLKSRQPELDVDIAWTQDYTQTLQQSLRDKLIGQGPDVALHAHNNIAMLARRNEIVPLDPFAARTGDAIGSSIGQVGDRRYGVPFTASVPVVYVNRDLVGGRRDLPTSWDGILSLAGKVAAPSGGAFFNYATDGSWTFMALIESLGGRVVNAAGTDIAFDSAEGLEAMEILAGFARVRKGQVLTAAQARQAFASGALAIHVDTTSRMRFFDEQAKGKFALAVLPFPLKTSAPARIPPSGGSLAIMTRDPARQTGAWALIASLMSPEVQSQIMTRTGFIPGRAASGARADLDNGLAATPHFDAIAPTLAVLGPWPSFPVDNPARVDKHVQDALVVLAAERATPKETLARIVAAARPA